MPTVRVVAISDTHIRLRELAPRLPDGDILVHGGDLTGIGSPHQIRLELEALAALPYQDKVFIAGNHDLLFEKNPTYAKSILGEFKTLTYLEDSAAVVQGVKFYGSPWTPMFCYWAFMIDRMTPELERKWDAIPEDLDVLITHGPPYGILDVSSYTKESVGCELLLQAVEEKKPKFHVFGHIHGSNGVQVGEHTTFINAAICDESYDPEQTIHTFEVEVN